MLEILKEKLLNIDIKFYITEKITFFLGNLSVKLNKIIYYKRFFIGNNYKIWGNIKLIIDGKGKILIGDNFHAVSSQSRSYWTIFSPCHITSIHGGIIEIADHVGLNGNTLVCRKKISIGKDTMIGPNTIISDHNGHVSKVVDRWNTADEAKEINIGKNCWIGANCIILKGVKIGDNTIIGAGSVVKSDCEQDSIYAGNPAIKIKKIN